jgi:hypothetical protein
MNNDIQTIARRLTHCKTIIGWGMVVFLSTVSLANSDFFMIPDQTIQWKTTRGLNYSPFDQFGHYTKAILTVHVPGSAEGDFFIGFPTSGERRELKNATNHVLTYFLSATTNSNFYLMDWPTDANRVISFTVSGNHSGTLQFPIYIWVDPGQMVPDHLFTDSIAISIYKGSVDGTAEKVGEGRIKLEVQVSDAIEVSLGNDQFNHISEFNVKFEALTEGSVLSYDAYVQAFSSYTLVISSKAKGYLRHHLDQVKTKIPYQVSVDDHPIIFDEFGKGKIIIEKEDNAENKHHKIKLVLGKTSHAFKGQYTDRLSIEAKANY